MRFIGTIYKIKMRCCFIVQYLHPKLIRSFRDVDGTAVKFLLIVWCMPNMAVATSSEVIQLRESVVFMFVLLEDVSSFCIYICICIDYYCRLMCAVVKKNRTEKTTH